MNSFNKFSNSTDAAQALTQAVKQNLHDILVKKEFATLAVSGGKSPITFFQILNQATLDWHRIRISLVDERLVPTNHADSNTQLVRQYLLQNQAEKAQFLPIVNDTANDEDLKNTTEAIQFALQHYQQPDILILGMGTDGHTASLFPKAPQFQDGIRSDYPLPLLHTTPITAPYERISMTLNAIMNTQHIYLSISGQEKFAIYQQAEHEINPEFPISYILNKVNTNVFYND